MSQQQHRFGDHSSFWGYRRFLMLPVLAACLTLPCSRAAGQSGGMDNLDPFATDPTAVEELPLDGAFDGSDPSSPVAPELVTPERQPAVAPPTKVIEKGEALPISPRLTKAKEALERGEYDRSLARLKEVRKELRRSELDGFYFLKAQNHFQKQEWQQAEEAFRRSLSYRARNSDALHLLGEIALRSGELERAERIFKEALWFGRYSEVDPSRSWLKLAEIYEQLDQPEKQLMALQQVSRGGRASDQDRATVEAQLALARAKLQAGEFEVAKKTLEGLQPEDPGLRLARHVLFSQLLMQSPGKLFRSKELERSAEQLNAELQADESAEVDGAVLSRAHETLVRLWIETGKPEKARESLKAGEKYLKSSPARSELERQLNLLG